MKKSSLLTAGFIGVASLTTQAALINRYSFSNPAGDATGGALTDSVGGAHGVFHGVFRWVFVRSVATLAAGES